MIRGILLAAGRGSRFGADKLLHPLPDAPDTPRSAPPAQTIATAAAVTLIEVIPDCVAVCRPEQKALITQLRAIGYQVTTCVDADQGMGFSLATAVEATDPIDDLIIALADMPYVSKSTIAEISRRLTRGAVLVQPLYQGKPGNPVGISRHLRQQLLAPQGDFGARHLLRQQSELLERFEVDDAGVIRDIDYPDDLAN